MCDNPLFDPKDIAKEYLDCFEEVETTCGNPWERVVERTASNRNVYDRPGLYDAGAGKGQRGAVATWSGQEFNRFKVENPNRTTGWRPTCDHEHEPVPAVCLDPFIGSGTVAQVAIKYGRAWLGFELNADYIELAEKRLAGVQLHF